VTMKRGSLALAAHEIPRATSSCASEPTSKPRTPQSPSAKNLTAPSGGLGREDGSHRRSAEPTGDAPFSLNARCARRISSLVMRACVGCDVSITRTHTHRNAAPMVARRFRAAKRSITIWYGLEVTKLQVFVAPQNLCEGTADPRGGCKYILIIHEYNSLRYITVPSRDRPSIRLTWQPRASCASR
jgi:hypothetical protein